MSKIFPENNSPVTITLYRDIPFDNTYKNHSLIYDWKYNNTSISSGTFAQSNFLERSYKRGNVVRKIYTSYTMTGEFNFAYGNGLVTSVVLELTSAQTLCNYMKVSSVGNGDLFYFITSITQVNGITYNLSLELDVLMTYGTEFLNSMKDVPVFTRKKHCFRVNSSGAFGCKDFGSIEPEFANIKASIVESKNNLSFDLTGASSTDKTTLKGLTWLYVVLAREYTLNEEMQTLLGTNFLNYNHKDDTYPFIVICLPMVEKCKFIYKSGDSIVHQTEVNVADKLMNLVGTGYYKGAKISPYPPFTDASNINLYYSGSVLQLEIKGYTTIASVSDAYSLINNFGNNKLLFVHSDITGAMSAFKEFIDWFIISNDSDNTFNMGDVNILRTDVTHAPSISNTMEVNEYKCLMPPFKKYLVKSISTQGLELRPDIVYSDNTSTEVTTFNTKLIATCYPYDNSYFTFCPTQNKFNSLANIGTDSVINYTMPVGENALEYWQQTQSAEYYQGKTAQAVTSGLSILGGIALIGIGATVGVASSGSLSPLGAKAILGGSTMIAGGIASEVNLSKSIEAHQIDLMNRPDSFTNVGSSYVHDLAVASYDITSETNQGMIPYILKLKCKDIDRECALEHYYNYGYEVNRECYFNTDLATDVYTNTLKLDNHLFTRTLFNYIRIEDDITNKIGRNSDIPYVVKQKLNAIFNNGITLWTFMKFPFTHGSTPIATSNTDSIDENYLFKMKYDNAEFYNQ